MDAKRIALILTAFMVVLILTACNLSGETSGTVSNQTDQADNAELTEISADEAIESVETLGFVDIDGSKINAIAVKYNIDLTGAKVSLDDFIIQDYVPIVVVFTS